jgi:hypothetical protein
MADRVNLSDPDVEPTDEQLIGLSKRAFADVPRARAEALQRLRAEIDVFRARVRQTFEEKRALRDSKK